MASPTSKTSARPSAENWVAKLLMMFIGGVGAVAAGAVMFNNHIESQQERAAQRRAFEHYEAATRPSATPAALPQGFIEAKLREQRLREHPLVTPGAAFNARGVQETGIAIVDAIDQAGVRKP